VRNISIEGWYRPGIFVSVPVQEVISLQILFVAA
jgi:hypothetical protein